MLASEVIFAEHSAPFGLPSAVWYVEAELQLGSWSFSLNFRRITEQSLTHSTPRKLAKVYRLSKFSSSVSYITGHK